MFISTREAYLGKRELKPLSSEWILLKGREHRGWDVDSIDSDMLKDGHIEVDYFVVPAEGQKAVNIRGQAQWRGDSNCDYWYYKFPDGNKIGVIAEGTFLKDNIEAIKSAVVKQYHRPVWDDQLRQGFNPKVEL